MSPLLLLLDGVLSQNEATMNVALEQIRSIEPFLKDTVISKSPLHSSATLEYIVERLLTAQPELAQVSSTADGSYPLHFAASIGNIRVASWLLKISPASALMHNKKGKIPLHYAAREGRTDMVHFLLQQVPSSAAVMTHKRKLPIHFAAGDGHFEVVRALLRVHPKGASTPSQKGKIALHFAARWGHLAIAKDLYQMCPSCVKILDLDGNVPLHDAAREGQLEMAKFLVEKYPEGMSKANIRDEVPLFGAIRSGNVELCRFFILSWPQSGEHVLQMVRPEDNVEAWDPVILDLCLRGAVNNFSGMPADEDASLVFSYSFPSDDERKRNPIAGRPKVLTLCDRGCSNSSTGEASIEVAAISESATARTTSSDVSNKDSWDRLTPGLEITMPRYKSPILRDDGYGKKRSAADKTNNNKKSRRTGTADDTSGTGYDYIRQALASQTFYQLHAALRSSATASVLECILDRYADEQLTQTDDDGKLPLHIALSHSHKKEMVDLILSRVWEPHKEASFCRDYLGRLPLHLALASRADSRLIEALLKENPSSGVDHCDAVDPLFGEKLPLHVAVENDCDISTIFLLVKSDPTAFQCWNDLTCS